MSKKIVGIFAAILLAAVALPTTVMAEAAQEAVLEEEGVIGIDPESPIYFLQTVLEDLRLRFTFGAEERAEFLYERAKRRTAEFEMLRQRLEAGDASERALKAMEQVSANFSRQMEGAEAQIARMGEQFQESAAEIGRGMEGVASKMAEQLGALERIRENAPDRTRDGLERTMENISKGIGSRGAGPGESGQENPPGQAGEQKGR